MICMWVVVGRIDSAKGSRICIRGPDFSFGRRYASIELQVAVLSLWESRGSRRLGNQMKINAHGIEPEG